jgi:aminoglycoside 2'-N-acetyltransferase I
VHDIAQIHTADLEPEDRRAIRRLLDEAFRGEFDDEDWEHTLGGVHILLRVKGELAGHVAVVQRRLYHADLAIRTGYVEGLAVGTAFRKRGYASVAMTAAEHVIAAAYDLGGLSDGTGIPGFYERRGWLAWRGPSSSLAPTGMQRTPDDDGAIYVLRTPTSPEFDVDGTIACDWRSGDVW